MTGEAESDRAQLRHRRPMGASDEAIAAAGKLSEALETTERARGHLYAFHQLTGHADLALDEAVRLLRAAGAHELAEQLATELIGRNVLAGRWTFQIVEEYDEGYYRTFRLVEQEARAALTGGRKHVYEAEMKERRRTRGHCAHTASPESGDQRAGTRPSAISDSAPGGTLRNQADHSRRW